MKSLPLHAVLLWPLSLVYAMVMRIRAWFYLVGVFPSDPSGAYVVSIGNLQAGGTGKTPFTVMLVNRWKEKARIGVVSRGYGRSTKGVLRVEPDRLEAATLFGDEPTLIAKSTSVPVFVGESRVRAAQDLIAAEGTRLILLDDGFQHLKLRRSFDIVLIDASAPDWHWRVLPAGRLREPLTALERADLVVLTKTELAEAAKLKALKADIRNRLDMLRRRQVQILALRQDLVVSSTVRAGKAYLVAGLASPSNFFELVKRQGVEVAGELAFGDHYSYSDADVRKIKSLASQAGANSVLTTEKDAVKLKAVWEKIEPALSLEVAGLNLIPVDESDRVGLERLDAIIMDQTRILSRPSRR